MKVLLTRNIRGSLYALIQTDSSIIEPCAGCVFRKIVSGYYECLNCNDFACFKPKDLGHIVWVDMKTIRKEKIDKINESTSN